MNSLQKHSILDRFYNLICKLTLFRRNTQRRYFQRDIMDAFWDFRQSSFLRVSDWMTDGLSRLTPCRRLPCEPRCESVWGCCCLEPVELYAVFWWTMRGMTVCRSRIADLPGQIVSVRRLTCIPCTGRHKGHTELVERGAATLRTAQRGRASG